MHPNYCQITILLVVDLCSSLAYFMTTYLLSIAGKFPIKTLVARQLPTNTYIHSMHIHTHTYHGDNTKQHPLLHSTVWWETFEVENFRRSVSEHFAEKTFAEYQTNHGWGVWHAQNFVEKTFAGGSQTTKFVNIFTLKFSAIRYITHTFLLLYIS